MNSLLTTSTPIVIGTESCGQCIATVRDLEAKAIDYIKVDASELTAAELDDVRARAHAGKKLQLPVVITPNGIWTGFRPDLIDTLTAPKEG